MANSNAFSRTQSASGASGFERFQAEFAGGLVCRGDAKYDSARKIWNACIDKHPKCIARCVGIDDVIAAVTFAREQKRLMPSTPGELTAYFGFMHTADGAPVSA